MMPTRTIRRRGFTLIELLVVLTIVAGLAALLMPALSTVREAASATVCAGNMGQIALAQSHYADECEGFFTDYYDNSLPTAAERLNSTWIMRLNLVTGIAVNRYDRPFDCATHRRRYGLNRIHQRAGDGATYPSFHLNNPMWWTYSNSHGKAPRGLHRSFVRCASATYLLLEGARFLAGAWQPYDAEAINPHPNPLGGSTEPRHGGGLNIAFFDGHVARHPGHPPHPAPAFSPWLGY